MIKKVLIVEDDSFSELLLKKMLDDCEKTIDVVSVKNGIEALEKLNNEKFDLLLLDVHLPLLNGKEVLEKIKKETKYNSLSIIVLSTDNASKTEMFNLGADEYLEKPIKREKFLSFVKKRLNPVF